VPLTKTTKTTKKHKEIKLKLRSLEAATLARQSNADQNHDNVKIVVEKCDLIIKAKTGTNF
jgi:hypothetical protein